MKRCLKIMPSIGTFNVGDEIIADSCSRELEELLPMTFWINSSSHMGIKSNFFYRIARRNIDHTFICGSNLLSSYSNVFRRQLNYTLRDTLFIQNAILLGAGWRDYQKAPSLYTKILYYRLFDDYCIHSVRDDYTLQQLKRMGINNVVNTGCPTLWKLDKKHCSNIPAEQGQSVIFTLTCYRKNSNLDSMLVNKLKNIYGKLYFWVQGIDDLEYLKELGLDSNINIIEPSLRAYDELLTNEKRIDYVVTRLHAGIRALQHGRRSFIVAIDNRAIEMGKDFNLPIITERQVNDLESICCSKYKTKIDIPMKNINIWRKQFK